MAPGNNERHPHPGHSGTGTIPKTKVRNNCNVPQEAAVTPTRRDMATNLVSTSLDWVPVSEYNSRGNYNQSRKQTNTISDQELTDLDNSGAFESGFGRFVPVRPQPRVLPLNVQNHNIASDTHDDGTASTASGHSLHHHAHQMQNGLNPHSNHAAAAVMIVNPTTPNAVTGNISQQFNASNQNRNNLTRNLNPGRNNFDGNINLSNNIAAPNSRSSGTKTVNLMNNMYEQSQGSFNNANENNQAHRESARALGDAMVAACPDAVAVERRLGQIREYIRVTSSLVDTMRNSEDEAFINHTKEEYDELVEMVMKLKESESKLEKMLNEKEPDNIEVPAEESKETQDASDGTSNAEPVETVTTENASDANKSLDEDKLNTDKNNNENNNTTAASHNLKKVNNLENEQINKSLQNIKAVVDEIDSIEIQANESSATKAQSEHMDKIEENSENESRDIEIKEIESTPYPEANENQVKKDDEALNAILRKNILSCVEKVARIEEMRKQPPSTSAEEDQQDVVVRPVSAQSNGSAYSENELWQNEIKNKMEMSQIRLAALKQQQKRLIKYQEEAKQQLEEMHRERQSQEIQTSMSNDNLNGMQGPSFSGNYHQNRMYAANQIGVATTLPQSSDMHAQHNMANNIDNDHGHSSHSNHQDERFSQRSANVADSEEAAVGQDSEPEEDDVALSEKHTLLQIKLRELQMKKQHMESLVSEFQKLQMATRAAGSHNTYSSSGEDSGVEESSRKFLGNKPGGNIKNEDPFKLMEIKAIKTALQKTKDLMRSVENYEVDNLPGAHDEAFQVSSHSNLNDNKSEGGGSLGGWSTEGSVCRVRNPLPPATRHKFTNEQHSQSMQQAHQSHEANIASLQDLAQELRMETEKIMGERARIKDMANKEMVRKHKKVNEEVRGAAGASGSAGGAGPVRPGPGPGPAERRQMQLRALLKDKQRELEALINKEALVTSPEVQQKPHCPPSAVNQSYASEHEEPDSRSEQLLLESQHRDNDMFRAGGDSVMGTRSINTVPSHLGSTYGSDSDSASRNKCNQRGRSRRRAQTERSDGAPLAPHPAHSRLEPRPDSTSGNVPPGASHTDSPSMSYGPATPPAWSAAKREQELRNQFTQNSHSQTMDRILGTPQVPFPPSMHTPFNMMMPYGMMGVGGCGCGCGVWGAWCWQQLALQQREIHQLRDQLGHLEERWRADNASHMLNNQVPPGNRANNYWDNFRSYSRQNLLSGSSKTNAEGPLAGPAQQPQPLAERSHNALRLSPSLSHPPAAPASIPIAPKRNTNASTQASQSLHNEEPPNRQTRRNGAYERSLSFSSAPDVLNMNHADDANARNDDNPVPNVNLNRQEALSNSFRNLNITNAIPEIVQSHANNLNSANSKKKSSSKLPAKNSSHSRNFALDYSQTSNINIASSSETPNPNLASTSRGGNDKATSKLFDLLRENVYTEVTTLIGVNESHPDFLIQLFRELQLISSDPLRQRVLQSIRNVLTQYSSMVAENNENPEEESRPEVVSTTCNGPNYHECDSISMQNPCPGSMPIDNKIVRFLLLKSEEICTSELLEALTSQILSCLGDTRHQSQKRLYELLLKYEGMRVCDVSSDIIENMPTLLSANESEEAVPLASEVSESSILQDVAGSLNLFSASDSQLHELNCPYEMWPGHVRHADIAGGELAHNHDIQDGSPRSSHEDKVDLISSEMLNGDLAEADQTHSEAGEEGAEGLPDLVDTDEVAPTEAEAEWLGLDRVPTRLHMGESSEKQKD